MVSLVYVALAVYMICWQKNIFYYDIYSLVLLAQYDIVEFV